MKIGLAAYAANAAKFELSTRELVLSGDGSKRAIPDIVAESVQIVDLTSGGDYAPRIRTWGIGLPGFWSGWYRLKSGEKALLCVTERSRVVYIPTRKGYAVLLSPQEPEQFVAALRAGALATG